MKKLKKGAGSVLTIDELAAFCKRKGFVYPSGEIYGGLAGFWDFGPNGVELYNNIKNAWWNYFVHQRGNIVGIEASIISNPKIWKASGHVAGFSDVAVPCRKCKKISKIDVAELSGAKCSFCKGELDKSGSKKLNMMLSTKIGPLEGDSVVSYLRPENAQGMFTDFRLVSETSRMKLPFGIAQIGKCFRNEIAPRDFLFRCREFTIGEFEFFINPEEKKCGIFDNAHRKIKVQLLNAETREKGKENLKSITIGDMVKEKRFDEWQAYWLAEQIMFFKGLGINVDKIKIREHMKSELSHYSSATFDLDYDYPFGSKEVAGNANRRQFDLTNHAKESSQKLDYFDEETKTRVVPRVIEPTFGMERILLAVIVEGYSYDKKRENIVLKLHPKLAPVKAAIFPIVRGEKMVNLSKEIYRELRKEWNILYDDSGSVGRRYSRNDEIGTPMCITIDEQSLKDETATIRWRDNAEQVRVKIIYLQDIVRKVINGENLFKLGKKVNTRKKV